MYSLYKAYKKLAKVVRRKHPLVIAGKPGWLQDSLIKTLRADPEIKWLGQVDRDRLPVLYNGALGFCYPSFYEGFGLPVLEALRCGCPVVTSRVSSLPEVGGEVVFYCDPHDTDSIYNGLLNLTKLTDKERQTRVLAGYNQAGKFNYQKGIDQLLAWINKQ